jgi:hypothetical protein
MDLYILFAVGCQSDRLKFRASVTLERLVLQLKL